MLASRHQTAVVRGSLQLLGTQPCMMAVPRLRKLKHDCASIRFLTVCPSEATLRRDAHDRGCDAP